MEKKHDIRMSVELSNLLDTVARDKRMTASEVVRLAVGEYVMKEIRLSNERRHQALEFSNPATSPETVPSRQAVSDADLAGHWGDVYGNDLRTA
ncbi:hypothetical protein ACWDU8_34875 [Streptomyces sp. NPDC003388]